ncbi:MAG: 16S rRNA (guanine(527)-N(7))-methyltransferase RsmG [bacterium]
MKHSEYEKEKGFEKDLLPQLVVQLHDVGINLSDCQQNQFRIYYHEILKWNEKVNLISKKDESKIIERHFLESSAIALFDVFRKGLFVLDLGSGGGFPGVPLKIVRPDLSITLLDSKRMKILFLRSLVEKLNLKDVDFICERAEEAGLKHKLRKNFDIVTSRAVAALPRLYQWAQPFLKTHGLLIAIKGSNVAKEIQELKLQFPEVPYEIRSLPLQTLSRTNKARIVFVYPVGPLHVSR